MIYNTQIRIKAGQLYARTKQKLHRIRLNKHNPQDTENIPICLYRKQANGNVTQETMPRRQISAAQRLAKAMAIFFGFTFPVGMAKTVAEDISTHTRFQKELPELISGAVDSARVKAQTYQDTIFWDEAVAIPKKLSRVVKAPKSPGGIFYSAIKANKDSLIKDLGIDSEKYDILTTVALKIGNEETKLGGSRKYKIINSIENSNYGRDIASGMRGFKEGDGTLSFGISQMKIDFYSTEEKALFDKYNITYGGNRTNINEPDKAAIATIIHLAKLDKDYPSYLEQIQQIKPDINNPSVQASIKRAQRIIFDRFNSGAIIDENVPTRKERALEALKSINGSSKEKQKLKNADLTIQDLEDLRIYASTVELPEQAYLAARWRNIRIIPTGDKKDIACANLLNIITQKGYVTNVDLVRNIYY